LAKSLILEVKSNIKVPNSKKRLHFYQELELGAWSMELETWNLELGAWNFLELPVRICINMLS